ncbi:MAG: MerR family transcriptional regulator [Streptococcus sp.]|nr:MerR family transcriptional regulator [Streptococcus sp.]
MTYSIGEIAKKFNLSVSTLRYYDKEGLIPNLEKSKSGIRIFNDFSISSLVTVECLKRSDMPLKDIKQFIEWCKEGDATLEKRRDMFLERRLLVEQQIQKLNKTLDYINHKCQYYEKAVNDGSEKNVLQTISTPEELSNYL